MFGFEAIEAHNGWAMALAGALIVMAGLTVLSVVISQLHRIVDLLEYRRRKHELNPDDAKAGPEVDTQPVSTPQPSVDDILEAATVYQPLVAHLGPSFQLSELYAVSSKHGLPHPHLTIKALREAGILIPHGNGEFSWKQGKPA